jgi:hypothetical protein
VVVFIFFQEKLGHLSNRSKASIFLITTLLFFSLARRELSSSGGVESLDAFLLNRLFKFDVWYTLNPEFFKDWLFFGKKTLRVTFSSFMKYP